MIVTIDSTNPRSVSALDLVAREGSWARAQLKDGQRFFAVPSRTRPNLYHLTDSESCTYEDHKYREVECSHIVAVRLQAARAEAEQQRRRPRRGGRKSGTASRRFLSAA